MRFERESFFKELLGLMQELAHMWNDPCWGCGSYWGDFVKLGVFYGDSEVAFLKQRIACLPAFFLVMKMSQKISVAILSTKVEQKVNKRQRNDTLPANHHHRSAIHPHRWLVLGSIWGGKMSPSARPLLLSLPLPIWVDQVGRRPAIWLSLKFSQRVKGYVIWLPSPPPIQQTC